jgi:hypothetical protein
VKPNTPILRAIALAVALSAFPQIVRSQSQCSCFIVYNAVDITVPCEGPWGAHVSFFVTASNTCAPGASVVTTYSQPPGSIFPPGPTMVCVTNQTPGIAPCVTCFNVNVIGCCGTNCLRVICPPDIVLPCNTATGVGGFVDSKQLLPILTNICGGPIPTTVSVGLSVPIPSGGGPVYFPPGENTVFACLTNSLTAYVDCCCFKVLVLTNCYPPAYTNPCPVIVTCPTNVNVCVTNEPGTGNVQLPVPTLVDACGHPIVIQGVSYTTPAGMFFPLGVTTVGVCVRWFDDFNNTSGTNCCCFDVDVDCCTNPCVNVLICPDDMVLDCPGPNGIVLNYTDSYSSCDPNAFVQCLPPPGTVIFGNTNVCCYLFGGGGTVILTQCCFKVTVLCPSNCVPTITCPNNIFVTCPGPRGAFVTYPTPTFSDSCNHPVNVVCNPPSGSFFTFGCKTVVCTAIDAINGNSTTCTFKVCVLKPGCYLRNPSFEQIVAAPQPPNACGAEPVDDAVYWKTLSGSPYLFRPPAGVPVNCWGNELPCDGTNYAGISYSAVPAFTTDQMIGQTVVPLSHGNRYRLRACLSLADNSPGPVLVEFALANKANPAQQFVINQTFVTQKVGWQPVFAQPPCFTVPRDTNIWDALIIRAAPLPPIVGTAQAGQVYIDNVNICCCTAVTIANPNNPTLSWFGPGTLMFNPDLGKPGGSQTLGGSGFMDMVTGMSTVQLDTSFFDVFTQGFFDVFIPEEMTMDCGCYP